MKKTAAAMPFVLFLFLLFVIPGPCFANKASATLQTPAGVQKGSEVTIRVNVSHEGNSVFHHVQWVYLKVNGKEIARWDYSATNRPDAERFFKEVKVAADGPLEIVAEASCNLHGSAGPVSAKIETQ